MQPTQQSLRIMTSAEDLISLSKNELTAKQVAEAICKTIQIAEAMINQTTDDNNVALIKEKIRVTLPIDRYSSLIDCRFCAHETLAPGIFHIEDIVTKAKITFDEHTLHLIKCHYHFDKGPYRVDPIVAGQILKQII